MARRVVGSDGQGRRAVSGQARAASDPARDPAGGAGAGAGAGGTGGVSGTGGLTGRTASSGRTGGAGRAVATTRTAASFGADRAGRTSPADGTDRTDRAARADDAQSNAKAVRTAGSAGASRSGRTGRTARSAASSGGSAPQGEAREETYGPRSGFVDARRLPDEDVVSRTLAETAGSLGVSTRPKVVDFNARLRERRKTSTRIIALRVLAGVGALAVLTAVVWFLFFSSVFRLDTGNITVTGGNEWVSTDEVVSIAGKQSGKSLFLVSSKQVVEQLTGIPGVTEATVSKDFPDALSVHIEAQEPAAMLKGPDGTLVAVDSKARVLNTVGDASTDGIPIIEVKDVNDSLDSRAVKEALKILGDLSDAMRGTVTAVSADTQDSITTELDGGAHVVVWGDSSDLKLKKAIVDKILADPNVIGDKTQIDVSAPKRPIIK